MSPIPRRSLLKAAAAVGAATQVSWALGAQNAQAAPAAAADGADPVTLDWLEDGGLGAAPGSTVGVPWPMGAHQEDQTFALTDEGGKAVPVQTWPLAYWPDGSLKWTAHAVSSGSGKLTLSPGTPAAPDKKVTVDSGGGTIDVSTGVITAKIGKDGATLIKSSPVARPRSRRTAGSSSSGSPGSRTRTRARSRQSGSTVPSTR